ncbi:MAG: TetR/AcrR family transcriptional regulator [Haliangiales bacterium]
MAKTSNRREELLEAALTVIADGGVDAVRARRVAATAGVPLGSVSYWFSSREVLIRDAFDYFLIKNTAFIKSLLDDRPMATPADLVEFLCAMVESEFRDPRVVMTEYEFILAAGRDPALAEAFVAWEAILLDTATSVMAALGIPEPARDARTIIEMVRGFEVLALTRDAPDLDDLKHRLTRLIEALKRPV